MLRPVSRCPVSVRIGCWAVLLSFLLFAGTARAELVSLQNLNSTGQSVEGTFDPNYTLIGAPDLYPGFNEKYPDYPNVYTCFTNGYPYVGPDVPWADYSGLGAGAEAHWISPQDDYRDYDQDPEGNSDAPGIWQYQTSFYVQSGVDPTTALLYGALSSDNCTLNVLINGEAVEGWAVNPGRCLADPNYFQIGGANANWTNDPDMQAGQLLRTSAFQAGWNTITFEVSNYDGPFPNPSGLIVWLEGEGEWSPAPAVPEASTIVLTLGGLGLLAAIRRRRNSRTR